MFLWIWPEPVRGSQREENLQKMSLKAQKNSPCFGRQLFYFFILSSSSSPWPFCCFYLTYASFRTVTDKNSKILTPTRTGTFLLTSMDREFYATVRSTDVWTSEVSWNSTSTNPMKGITPPFAALKSSPSLFLTSLQSSLTLIIDGRSSLNQLLILWTPESLYPTIPQPTYEIPQQSPPLNIHNKLHFIPTSLATSNCCVGVRWLTNP